jgi:hypothetical protein
MKTYMYPFARDTRVSQKFGANDTQYNLSGKHTGEDAAVPVGTPVHAAGDGVIVAAGYFPNYNNEWLYGPMGGLTLVEDCGTDEPTFGWAHLSKVFVKEGDRVVKGQVVAESGESGAATGPHCHIEALPPNWNTYNGTYGRIDPRIYMTEFPGEIVSLGTITPEDEEVKPEQMQELKDFIYKTLGTMLEQYHDVTRATVVKQVNDKAAEISYADRVFNQTTSNKNADRVINIIKAGK